MTEKFSATARVRVTIDVDLSQPWSDSEVGVITKRARLQVDREVRELIEKETRISLIKVGDVFITLHSKI